MRTAALILILAILTTLVAGAQCVTACADPTPPPCHHSPQKAAKTCDASSVFDDKHPVTLVEVPASASSARVPARESAPLPHDPPRLLAPGDSAPLVLRI
jgi:hypothetical protein